MKLQLPAKNKRILVALAASLAFHLSLLFFKISTPQQTFVPPSSRVPTQLDVRLSPPERAAPPPALPPQAAPAQPAAKPRRQASQIQTPSMVAEAERTWTQAEKDEMNRFPS